MATTDISLSFDTNNLNLENMEINYNNAAVALNNNASLSIVPLTPPNNNTYNIMQPTVTYSPRPRSLLTGSTVSNVIIGQNDVNDLQTSGIEDIDFDVGGDIVTLTLNDTVNLNLETTSNSNISLLNHNPSVYIENLAKSLGAAINQISMFQVSNYIFFFIPYGGITNIYQSTILANNIITIPVQLNITLPVPVYTPYLAINGSYLYVCGVATSNEVVIYYAPIDSDYNLSAFTVYTGTIPSIPNNLVHTNNLLYPQLIANLFLIYNNYVYILGGIGTGFQYAYATISANGVIGTFTLGDSLFGTPTTINSVSNNSASLTSLMGISQTQIYKGTIYVSGLVETYTENYGNSASFYGQSSNFYTISINSDGTLATAVSYNYPSNQYFCDTTMYIYNDNVYLLNCYSVDQTYQANNTGFTGEGNVYYSNINSLGTWNLLNQGFSNGSDTYYAKLFNQILVFSSNSNTFSKFNINNNSLLLGYVVPNPSYSNGPYTAFYPNYNTFYYSSTNTFFTVTASNFTSFSFNQNNQLLSNGISNLEVNSGLANLSGFIYENYLYITNTNDINSTISNDIYQYSINKYNVLENPVLMTNPSGLPIYVYTSTIINGVIYLLGGSTTPTYDGSGVAVNTAVYTFTVSSAGVLSAWTESSLTTPTAGVVANVVNISDNYLLLVGADGNIYSSTITSNVPGDFTILDSSMTSVFVSSNMGDCYVNSLRYINGYLFLGFIPDSNSNLKMYYAPYDETTNTIGEWLSISTKIPDTYHPSFYYYEPNNTIVAIDDYNSLLEVFYLDNQDFTYSLVPTTAFSSLPTNYYFNKIKAYGLVGDINQGQNLQPLTISSSAFSDGTYTLTYNSLTNSNSGLNVYLNLYDLYQGDIISEIQIAVQGRQYTLPPFT